MVRKRDSGELYFMVKNEEWVMLARRIDDPLSVLLSIRKVGNEKWTDTAILFPYDHEHADQWYKILDPAKSLEKPSATFAEFAHGLILHRQALKARLDLPDWFNLDMALQRLIDDILIRRWRNQLIDRINKDDNFARGLAIMMGLTRK